MAHRRQHLGDILVGQRLITAEQLETALEFQRTKPAPLGAILIQRGFVSERQIHRALAAQLGVSPWDAAHDKPDPKLKNFVPAEVCRENLLLPVCFQGDLLKIAMANPHDVEAIDLVRNLTKARRVEPMLAMKDYLLKVIDSWESSSDTGQSDLSNLVDQAIKESGRATRKHENAMLSEADTRPVIAVVNQILSNAIRMGASDVHIEPAPDKIQVRYRIDGELRKMLEFPLDMMPMLTVRLKIMAELDIVEWRTPQDGRISATVDDRDVDLRISVLPNYRGSRIVLRILERTAAMRDLGDLGLNSENLELYQRMIHRPHGLVLVTGPTGSGKTTTLYATLNELKSVTTNILTCEDPVEYEIPGISQSHVHEKVGLTFASLLRSALRQDPDIILVGEIRDKETAETAIRAALTGHLVLSTLHCNDAPSSIPRLIDMGVDPYLLSTCLVGVTAQRLVRQLCPDCRQIESEMGLAPWAAHSLKDMDGAKFFGPGECSRCQRSGYRGRVAVHEVMPISSKVAHAIAHQESLDVVKEAASLAGYRPMIEDAMIKSAAGFTSVSEIGRVLVLGDFEDVQPADGGLIRLAA